MGQLSNFTGLLPSVDPMNLGANAATEAINVDLSSGRIDLWRKPKYVMDVNGCSGIFCDCRFIPHRHKDDYLVNVGPDAIASGPCQVCPTYLCGDMAGKALGFPEPTEAPIVVSEEEEVPDDCYTELRYYFYTYGNEKDEGKPSGPSEGIKANKGDCVRITVPPYDLDCPCPYDITKIRIYRVHNIGIVGQGDGTNPAGFLTPVPPIGNMIGDPEPQWTHPINSDSGCFLVDCVDVDPNSNIVIEDKHDGLGLGEAMVSEEACAPEKDLCIVGETDNGSLVGFSRATDTIWFSERNQHHHWPIRSMICLEGRKIKDLCVLRNTVVALTDAEPHLIQDDSDCLGEEPRTVVPLPRSVPACDRGTCTSRGVVFPSNDGLYLITETGGITNITERLINKRDWMTYGVCDVDIAEYCQSLFITMPGLNGIITWGNDVQPVTLSHISFCPDCWITDEGGSRLYFLAGGSLFEWDGENEYLEGVWTSAFVPLDFIPVSALSLEYSSVIAKETVCEPAVVEILIDGCVEACGTPANCEGIRFRQCRGKYMQVRVRTREPVRLICFGSSLSSLNQRAAA